MQRYFFDLKTDVDVAYDYRGKEFDHLDKATQLAELLALDVAMSHNADEVLGREIQVRDIKGGQLFSVTIHYQPDLVAA